MVTISYWRGKIRAMLHLDDNPHRIALAFSLGVFIGFSPFIGLHLVSAVFLAWVLRLNTLAVVLGTLLNNPWTFAPIFGTSLWVGIEIYGRHHLLHPIQWHELTVVNAIPQLEPYLIPFLLGTTLLGIAAGAIAYPCAYYFVKEYRHLRHRAEGTPHV
ncbi:MAG: DUF2062 domain-containing protein [Nitrospirae bacterium]|nr:DUF2062 domain-containing protein [Nitrospirota bacterium]